MNAGTQSGAHRGLVLPGRALRRLREVGIFAQASVSLEYQQFAKRYVVRGVESGGAIEDLGRYVTFCGDQGEPLPWLHPLDGIGLNGVHALVIAPSLVRVEMFRRGQTYDLLISRIAPNSESNGKRPHLQSAVIFHAQEGYLPADAGKAGRNQKESQIPAFYSRSGELLAVPGQFEAVIKAASTGATCLGCNHPHYLQAPETLSPLHVILPNAKDNPAITAASHEGGDS